MDGAALDPAASPREEPAPGVALRVGDEERFAVDGRLQRAVGEGRLTLAEYEERSGLVWRARTQDELAAVTRDLPLVEPVPAAAPLVGPPARTGARARRVLALMSGDQLRGPVAPGQGVEAYAVMGGARVDLRQGDLPSYVRVRAVAVMGGVEVFVPRGVTVHLSGLSVMGGRDARTEPARPGAPVVHVEGYALMGGIEVKHGAPEDEPTALSAAPVDLSKHLGPQRGAPEVLPAALPAVVAHGSVRRPGRARHGRRRFVLAAVAAVALVVGVPAVADADERAVFGSTVKHVGPGQSVDVAALFGSVTVVVPDTATVLSSGGMVFGSTDCDECGPVPGGVVGAGGGAGAADTVEVHSQGAFGSVEIVRESAFARDHADHDPDD